MESVERECGSAPFWGPLPGLQELQQEAWVGGYGARVDSGPRHGCRNT